MQLVASSIETFLPVLFNLCRIPTAVSRAVERYGRELDRDMSHVSRRHVEGLKEDARSRLARQLGVSAEELAIVRNTSEANNIIVQGLPPERERSQMVHGPAGGWIAVCAAASRRAHLAKLRQRSLGW